jgi:O-antigen ligase
MPTLAILTLLLAPTYALRFNFLGKPTNFLMLWVFLFWLIFAFYILYKKQLAEFFSFIKKEDKKILILTALFSLAGLISLFIKGFDQKKLGQFIVLFLQPISLFFIYRYIIFKHPKTKNLLLVTCYYFLAAMGLYAIFQYFTLIGVPQEFWGNSVEPKRAVAFFGHPNFYALFSAPLLALLIPDLFSNLKAKIINLKSILWVIGTVGLFLSMSRAGWLGLAAAVLIYLIVAADKKIRKIVFGAAITILIIISCIPNFRYRLMLPFYGEKSTVSRFSLWHTGIKGIKESPIFGLGLNGFSNQWNTLNTDPNLDTHNFPHNIFLDLWVETGILGLLSLVGLIGIYLYRGFKKYVIPSELNEPRNPLSVQNAKDKESLSSSSDALAVGRGDIIKLGISLFLICFLVQGQLDNPYFKNDLALVFWMILALI